MSQSVPNSAAQAGASVGHHARTFDTPEPVSVSIEIGVGAVQVTATERTDTIVEVLPGRPGHGADRALVEQTSVERAGNLVVIRQPRHWPRYLFGPRRLRESIDIRIALPAGSELRVDTLATGAVWCSGRLGQAQVSTGFGEIRIEHTGPLRVSTGFGDISVDRAGGRVEAKAGSGAVRIGAIDGPAVVRNANGDTWIGQVSGDLEVKAANGTIAVDRAGAEVTARTANGPVLLGEVAHGAVLAHTAMGRVEVGVRACVAARLDLHTRFGNILNELEAAAGPEPGEDTVQIHARTAAGDITVRRC